MPLRVFAFAILLASAAASAEVEIRVIDTGPGLATVTRFANGDIMVYDTGHWNHDPAVFNEFRDFIGDTDIDLLITSHSDSDHVAATDELFNEYRVQRVLRTGFERVGTNTWEDHRDAILAASGQGLTHDVNLAEVTLPHGTTYTFGDATVTYLAGFHEPPDDWGLSGSESRNGNSIVVRLDYQGRSVLFTGDAVGLVEASAPDAPAIATERYLIEHREERPIDADVLIAPHHGSDDASSTEFIRHVSPRWVIFPSGHDHGHPKDTTAERYLALGYAPECLLRTDRGDDEGEDEWAFGRVSGHSDPTADDGITIVLRDSGEAPLVGYGDTEPVDCPEIAMDVPEPTPGPVVKRSRSGICHTTESPWYERTRHFDPFPNLESCLASGGREI